MTGPLHGVRVIDLTTVAMGPWATQTLGDMGADVIKVEAPAGDHFRVTPPARHPQMGATFLNLNRNKRSIVLDLKHADDMAVLKDLLADADVFVCNVRPQSMRLAQGPPMVEAEVEMVEFLGTESVLTCSAVDAPDQRICAVLTGNCVDLRGKRIGLEFTPEEAHFFDATSGRRLPV